MTEAARPAREAWWRRLYRQFVGLPPHLAWLDQELPVVVPWIVRFQRLVIFVLPTSALLLAAGDLLPAFGSTALGDDARLALAAVFLVGYIGTGVVLAMYIGAHGLVRLVRGPARSWRLAALSAVALLVVGLFAFGLSPFVLAMLGR